MIAPRWKKILRDLWLNRTRTLLVVLSISVGVFAVGVVTQTFTTVGQELAVSYPKANPASATLYPDDFDKELVDTVRRIPGVADAEGRAVATGQIRLGEDDRRPFNVFAVADFNDIRIGKITPQSAYAPAPGFHGERGHWPPGSHEIVLERSSLLVPGLVPQGLQVGDKVIISFNDRQRELMVAGLAYHPSYYPAPFNNAAYGFVSMHTFEWLVGSNQYNMLLMTVSKDKLDQSHVRDVANAAKTKIESGGRTVYGLDVPEPGKHPIQDYFTGMLLLLNLLSYGSLLLSGFLVTNIVNALLAQQVRQIGIMKALGARSGQMIAMYLGMVVIFGILALLIAIPLASVVAGLATRYLAGLANVDFANTDVPPQLLILEIVIGVALPLLAALVPITFGMRITVCEAISSYGMGKVQARAGMIDRWIDRVRGVSRPVLISFRNTFRRKSRLLLTLTTLTLAGTIFISVNSVHSSMLLTLDDAWKSWNWDVLIRFDKLYRTDFVESIARRVTGVDFVESWGGAGARYVRKDKSESETIQLFAPPPNTQLMIPNVVEGRWLAPDDENAIVLGMDVFKVEKDIKLGGEIKLKMWGKESSWIVVGKLRTIGSMGGIGVAYVNYPYFGRAIGHLGRAGQIEIATKEHAGEYQQKVMDALLAAYKEKGVQATADSYTKHFLRQNSEFFFTIITALLMAMAVLMAIVGGLGLMGTMSINVLERTREIGVMRAIGASNGAVRGIVMSEGLFIGLLSGLISTFLSYPLSQAVCGLVGEAIFQLPLSFAFSPGGTIIWLAIVTVLSAISSFLPALNASRLTVREVLAYE